MDKVLSEVSGVGLMRRSGRVKGQPEVAQARAVRRASGQGGVDHVGH